MHREIGGAECGKSKLCNSCSEKKDTGEPMKAFCFDEKAVGDSDETYLYELKASLMTPSELEYFQMHPIRFAGGLYSAGTGESCLIY